MNSNVNHSIISMESEDLRTLVTEVKETIATNADYKFSAAELWNIQKKMKTAQKVSRRRDIYA